MTGKWALDPWYPGIIDPWYPYRVLEYDTPITPKGAVPEFYNYYAYRDFLREVEDKATRKKNPDYDECCECGTCHTPGVEPYLYTPLSDEELNLRRDYLEKYKEDHASPKVFKWRRIELPSDINHPKEAEK